MNPVIVLSLGAGVQSSALIILADQGKIPRPDFAVFADTQSEPEEVYDWMNKLEKFVSIPIIRTTKGSLEQDTLNHETKRFASIPFFVKNPDQSQGLARRQCTAEYKLGPIFKAVRTKLGYVPKQRMKTPVTMQIGISREEIYRMKDSRVKWIKNVYPLIDLNMTRQQCVDFVKATGLGTPPRSACYFCPYHNDAEWMRIKADPKLWAKTIAFDAAIRKQSKFAGENFLHRQMIPIDQVDLDPHRDQMNLFNNECEGMCGV
jgi:hypothetical protein